MPLGLAVALDGGQAKVDLDDKELMERPGAGAGSDQRELIRQGGGEGQGGLTPIIVGRGSPLRN